MLINSPVLLIMFNRPGCAAKVFNEIRKQKPKELFVAADGPRKDVDGEIELCLQTRKVIESVDWTCKVKTLFRESNVGCKKAVCSAIDWFFEHVEEGIILEDDCLPSQDFFCYCDEMLERYRSDLRVMHVGGTNLQDGQLWGDGSYYFSKIVHVWGWATWKRAWNLYDRELTTYSCFIKNNLIEDVYENKKMQKFWIDCLNKVNNNEVDTWDYQWVYSVLINNAVSITPNVNLISNVGFGNDGTHTHDERDQCSNRNVGSLMKVKHPSIFVVNRKADQYVNRRYFSPPSLKVRILSRVSNILKGFGKYK